MLHYSAVLSQLPKLPCWGSALLRPPLTHSEAQLPNLYNPLPRSRPCPPVTISLKPTILQYNPQLPQSTSVRHLNPPCNPAPLPRPNSLSAVTLIPQDRQHLAPILPASQPRIVSYPLTFSRSYDLPPIKKQRWNSFCGGRNYGAIAPPFLPSSTPTCVTCLNHLSHPKLALFWPLLPSRKPSPAPAASFNHFLEGVKSPFQPGTSLSPFLVLH